VKACSELVDPDCGSIVGAAMMREMAQGALPGMTGKRKVPGGIALETAEPMDELEATMDAGDLRGVIDRSCPLARIAEAHAHVDGGHKAGNVEVTL